MPVNTRNQLLNQHKLNALMWVALVVLTTSYFYFYDHYYADKSPVYLLTLVTSIKAWLVWLALAAGISQIISHTSSKQILSRQFLRQFLLGALFTCTLALTYQAIVFSGQTALVETLLFCYLPANLKIYVLVVLFNLFITHFDTWTSFIRQQRQPHQINCQTTRNTLVSIDINSMTHVASFGNYVHIYTQTTSYTKRSTLKQMEQRLSAHGFIRIHRSSLVNKAAIEAFDGKLVYFKHGINLPIGRNYKQRFKKLMLNPSG